MTEKQAISHARTYAKYWLLKPMQHNIRKVADHFPETRDLCNEINGLIVSVLMEISVNPKETIKPWVISEKKA